MSHVPCTACQSSDAGWQFPDGGIYCYSCGHYDGSGAGVPDQPQKPRRLLKLIDVDVRAIEPRGINDITAEKWQYGYGECMGEKCQVAQFRDEKGRVVAQKLRFADKRFMVTGDLSKAGLFGQHLWKAGGKIVTVTEGELDALSVSQAQDNKWPVVSIPNGAQGAAGAITKAMEWLEKFERVVFMFDMDEPGQTAARECAALLTPGKSHIAVLPLKDANEMLMARRNRELLSAIFEAPVWRPDGLISGDAVWTKMFEEDAADSLAFPHKGIQEKTHGIRAGELTVVVAGTGAGKSTVCREVAHHLAVTSDAKVAYVALEETVRRSALGLISVGVNKPLHLFDNATINTPEVRAEFERLKDKVVYYDHFGSLASDHLMSKLRFLVKGEGCRYLFLDHLSIVVSGMDINTDERRQIDLVMTRLVSLAQESGAHIFVVVHLKKSEKGETHEEGRRITLDDLRGSGGIKQLGWNILALERDQQADDDTKNIARIRVLKCRHTGLTGEAGYMRYDHDTGRLTEYAGEFGEEPAAAGESDFD